MLAEVHETVNNRFVDQQPLGPLTQGFSYERKT